LKSSKSQFLLFGHLVYFSTLYQTYKSLDTDFFDYPPIRFDENVISWDKIIKENILQPFLPKNRIFLQHIMKGLQEEEQQLNLGSVYGKVPDVRRKSYILTGDAANAEQIEKQLNRVRKKMEKKVRIVSSKGAVNISRKFIVRATERSEIFKRRKAALEREEEKSGIVHSRFYHMNLSLNDIPNSDFFQLYEPEAEEKVKPKQPRPRRTTEF